MDKKILFVFNFFLFIGFLLFNPSSVWAADYYVANNGSDSNSGNQSSPWETIGYAFSQLKAGDKLYIREGEYITRSGGWSFDASGTEGNPIVVTNYPGEQVRFRINSQSGDYHAILCWASPDWGTPKADYVKIIGTKVTSQVLPNGISSDKGIVIIGPDLKNDGQHTLAVGVAVSHCDNWEVAGIDFVDVGYAIFTWKKRSLETGSEHYNTKSMYVHDNRVHGFYAESGMQFNGDFNRIENNEFYKYHDQHFTSFGCQHLNILGHDNIIRGNKISELGSKDDCAGILFEWDIADRNLVEKNEIWDTDTAIFVAGGDDNLIRNNLVISSDSASGGNEGIYLYSFDNSSGWPCDEPSVILPKNNSSDPDYQFYYQPRNCHSYGNQIYNNDIYGYNEAIRIYQVMPENTIIRNNALVNWSRGGICFYDAGSGSCKSLPGSLTADHNADSGNFGFVNQSNYDFHLMANSPLIDVGYNLGSLVTDDFEGNPRPQGDGYDIGAYEYGSGGTPSPSPKPECQADLSGDGNVNLADIVALLGKWGQTGNFPEDLNNNGRVDLADIQFILTYWGQGCQ